MVEVARIIFVSETYSYTQFGLLVVRLLTGALSMPAVARNKFYDDCRSVGIIVKPPTLLHFQLGPAPEVQLSYGLRSLKAFSRAKRNVSVALEPVASNSIPLWQSSLFCDVRGVSYSVSYSSRGRVARFFET